MTTAPQPGAGAARVLVSGAAGFVGLPVVRELARRGAEVHALSRRPDPPRAPGVRWHRVELADGDAVAAVMRELRPERLVHLAWYTEHGRFWDARENIDWVERSLRLTRAFARNGGRRAVLLGTCAEYDWSATGAPLHETRSRVAPGALYGVAKDALRRAAAAQAEREGFELAWARLFFLYGPREDPRRLVPSLVNALLAGAPVATGGGEQVRDYLHVEDVAGALAALLDSSVVGAVNVASGVGIAMGELVSRHVGLIGHPELVRRGALPDRPGDPPSLVADVGRLREEVGFRPRWTLADGLAETVRWWESQGDLASGAAWRR